MYLHLILPRLLWEPGHEWLLAISYGDFFEASDLIRKKLIHYEKHRESCFFQSHLRLVCRWISWYAILALAIKKCRKVLIVETQRHEAYQIFGKLFNFVSYNFIGNFSKSWILSLTIYDRLYLISLVQVLVQCTSIVLYIRLGHLYFEQTLQKNQKRVLI